MFFSYAKISLTIIAILKSSRAQDNCSTALNKGESCISIRDCPSILALLSKTDGLGDDEKETLRKSQCGFEGNVPKVCCPKDTKESTASNKPAIISGSGSAASQSPPNVMNHPNLGLINTDDCGGITETRIVGGSQTKVLEFPWMALIAFNINGQGSNQFGCGGSLINKRYVLTAAHCVTALGPGFEVAAVRIGDHDISREKDCDVEDGVKVVCADKYQDFKVEKTHIHKEYVKKTHRNDIALIRLDRDVDLKPNAKPICLPFGDAVTLKSKKVIVTGWGTTESGSRSDVLLKVRLDVFPTEECSKIYIEKNNIEIWYKQLCAGANTSGRDSCTGDSGGPLQFPGLLNGQPKYIQYGIVGFGPDGCGLAGYPGVYTKVDQYMDWILDNIEE